MAKSTNSYDAMFSDFMNSMAETPIAETASTNIPVNSPAKDELGLNYAEEKIVMVPLSKLDTFENHCFNVLDNDRETLLLKESIEKSGQLQPILVMPKEGTDRFEIIAGHRRCRALELLGREEAKAIVLPSLERDVARLIMIDTNAATRSLTPCEKGRMFLLRQGVLKNLSMEDTLTEREKQLVESSEGKYSRRSIFYYISLTRLIPEFQALVDASEIATVAGSHFADLNEDDQRALYKDLDGNYDVTIPQAQSVKNAVRSTGYNSEVVLGILGRVKSLARPKQQKLSFSTDEIHKDYLSYSSPKLIKKAILEDSSSWRMLMEKLGIDDRGNNMEAVDIIVRRMTEH